MILKPSAEHFVVGYERADSSRVFYGAGAPEIFYTCESASLVAGNLDSVTEMRLRDDAAGGWQVYKATFEKAEKPEEKPQGSPPRTIAMSMLWD